MDVNDHSRAVARRRVLFAGGCSVLLGADAARPARAASDAPDSAFAPAVSALAAAAAAAGQPDIFLARLDEALRRTVGHKLFTVLVVNLEKGQNERYYTSNPKDYPTGGSKPLDRSSVFFKQIVEAGKPRICYDYEDVKRAFFDHELIQALGCESAVNYPVRWNGQTIGSLNLLHDKDWYGEQQYPKLAAFAALTVPAIMDIVRTW